MDTRRRFFIKQTLTNELNAGPKAKIDTYKTLERMGYEPIIYVSHATARLLRYLEGITIILKLIKLKNSIVFIENPIKNYRFVNIGTRLMKLRNNHLILLVHDIESERYVSPKRLEYSFINSFDSVIVHNESMKAFLINHLDEKTKMYTLGLFDYLVDGEFELALKSTLAGTEKNKWEIIFCGNLGRVKSAFIYGLREINPQNWVLNLYGLGVEDISDIAGIRYQGSFDPNKPTIAENSDFGLIWDGDSIETCNGVMGNYMKINNPHKLSLYIALNLPVIVWKHAAISRFVEENGLGFSINNLTEISDKLSNLTNCDYQGYIHNLQSFNKKVTAGEYLNSALKQIDSHLGRLT